MKIKQKIINKILRYLLNATTEDAFMQVLMKKDLHGTKGYGIMIGGKVLDKEETKNLVSEARMIQRLKLWKMMVESQKWVANDTDDLHFPKAVLYNIDVWEKKLTNISEIHFDK
jgi:hypothetical protein